MAHYLILELVEPRDGSSKPRWEVAEVEASSREKAAAEYADRLEVDGESHRLSVYLLREPKPVTIRVTPKMVRADAVEVAE